MTDIEQIVERVLERLEEGWFRSPWMDTRQAADYLGWPTSKVYALTSPGGIPVHRVGKYLLFHRDELDSWVRAQ